MKLKIIFISTVLFLFAMTVFGQHSGNSVLDGDRYYGQNSQSKIRYRYLSDTSFVIQTHVLINVTADNYVATFGVSESSTTVSDANTKIDKRIQDFISALTKMKIARSDIYVDMTTQTQISDYKVTGTYAEQYIIGFEQKKNVIVKFTNIEDLDKMVILASEYGIYDLVKVNYLVVDIDKVYSQLFQAATDVINSRKELYIKTTNIKLTTSSQIYDESFYSFEPFQLYKNYTPNITTEYHDYSAYAKRKDLKKNTTYYYNKIDYSGFDRVINPIVIEPAVEFVLMLQIKFNIEKQ
jgi:uncharacterized protein YggE